MVDLDYQLYITGRIARQVSRKMKNYPPIAGRISHGVNGQITKISLNKKAYLGIGQRKRIGLLKCFYQYRNLVLYRIKAGNNLYRT